MNAKKRATNPKNIIVRERISVKPAPKAKGAKQKKSGVKLSTIKAPAAEGKILQMAGQPRWERSSNGDVTIEHSEMGLNISSAATTLQFSCVGSPIHPLNASMFPWLSTIAQGWESYVFEKLEVRYMTDLGSNTAGAIYMGVDYDCLDDVPTSKRSLMSYRSSVRAEVWCRELLFRAMKEDLQKRKTYFVGVPAVTGTFTTSIRAASDEDLRLSVTGNLLLASAGVTATALELGDIVVSYRIRLMTPQTNALGAVNAYSMVATPTYSSGTQTAALPWGPYATYPYVSDGTPVPGFPQEFSTNGVYYDPLALGLTTPAWGFSKASTTYMIVGTVRGSGSGSLSGSVIGVTGGATDPGLGDPAEGLSNLTDQVVFLHFVVSAATLGTSGYFGGVRWLGSALSMAGTNEARMRIIEVPSVVSLTKKGFKSGSLWSLHSLCWDLPSLAKAPSVSKPDEEVSALSQPSISPFLCPEDVSAKHTFRVRDESKEGCADKHEVVCKSCGFSLTEYLSSKKETEQTV